MGNSQQQQKLPKHKPATKIQIEIALKTVLAHVVLERDRRIELLKKAEMELKSKIENANINSWEDLQTPRNSEFIKNLTHEAFSNVKHIQWIQGANIVQNYVKLLADRSLYLERGQYDAKSIEELRPAIATVIYSTHVLNLKAVQAFNSIIEQCFNPAIVESSFKGLYVDEKLKRLFSTLLPPPQELHDYIKGLLKRYFASSAPDVQAQLAMLEDMMTQIATTGTVVPPQDPNPPNFDSQPPPVISQPPPVISQPPPAPVQPPPPMIPDASYANAQQMSMNQQYDKPSQPKSDIFASGFDMGMMNNQPQQSILPNNTPQQPGMFSNSNAPGFVQSQQYNMDPNFSMPQQPAYGVSGPTQMNYPQQSFQPPQQQSFQPPVQQNYLDPFNNSQQPGYVQSQQFQPVPGWSQAPANPNLSGPTQVNVPTDLVQIQEVQESKFSQNNVSSFFSKNLIGCVNTPRTCQSKCSQFKH